MTSYRSNPGLVTLAVPKKGRLYDECFKVLTGAGIKYKRQARLDMAWCDENVQLPLRIVFLNACDIPKFVSDGSVDIGICGLDYCEELKAERRSLKETHGEAFVLQKLGFGKCSIDILVPSDHPATTPSDLLGKGIATSFPHLSREYFQTLRGSDSDEGAVTIHTLAGSVEVAVELKLGEAVIDLVETGDTMRAAGLRKLSEVLTTEAALICNPAFKKFHEKACLTEKDLRNAYPHANIEMESKRWRTVRSVHKHIESYIKATNFGYVAYNCKASQVEAVSKITPGEKGPDVSTIGQIDGEEWVSARVMVPMKSVHYKMQQLEELGARHILLTSIAAYRAGTD